MEQPALIAARALVYASLLPAAGLPLYGFAAGRGANRSRRARLATVALAVIAALASVWWLLEDVAAMAMVPLAELDRATVQMVVAATPLGLALEVRMAALALLIVATLARWPTAVVALAAFASLVSVALTGHAGAGEGLSGAVHCLGDALHLAAAACWIGALATFVAASFAPVGLQPALAQRLAHFGGVGTWIVGIMVATGLANTLLVTGWPVPLRSAWIRLLLAKLVLFAIMLGCAGLNRWFLVPALDRREPRAAMHLTLSLLGETAAALAILLVVAQLGTLDPLG